MGMGAVMLDDVDRTRAVFALLYVSRELFATQPLVQVEWLDTVERVAADLGVDLEGLGGAVDAWLSDS